MHILIIPSEYFDESRKPNAGIFQKDHTLLFESKGHRVGVLAIKPQANYHQFINAVKGGIKGNNKHQFQLSLFYFRVLIKSLFFPINKLLKNYCINKTTVVKYVGGYGLIHYRNQNKVINLWRDVGEKALRSYIKKKGKPDIIHAHNVIYAGMVARFLSEKYKIPMTLTERSSQHIMQDMDKELCELVESELKMVSDINSVSPSLGRQIENKYNLIPETVEWLPNVVNNIFFDKGHENTINNRLSEEFVFLNVANLIGLKGQSELISAFCSIFKGDSRFKLRIGGDGDEEKCLNTLIKELGVESQVKLLDQLSRQEVRDEMRNCQVFVLPSHYETFGVVLIEAMALGKPVLATACGGPECIVNEKNGILVPPKDVNALAKGMEKMVENLEKYNPAEIKDDLVKRFGQEAFYERVMKIYKKAIYDYHN